MLDVSRLLEQGLAAHRAGHAEAATDAYRAVLAANPDQPSALYLYGALLLTDAASAEGEAMLLRAAALRPGHCDSRLSLANAYHRRGDAAAAMEHWRQVLALEPGHLGASLNAARQCGASGEWRVACDLARAALRLHPGHAGLWLALASALLTGGLNEAAIDAAEAAIALEGACAEAWLLLGAALSRLGRGEQAVAALHRARSLDGESARVELHLGNALLDLDQFEQAESHLRRSIALDRSLAEAHSSLGFLLSSTGRLPEALQWHEAAVALRPDLAAARSNLAATLLLAGDFRTGFEAYEWRKRKVGSAHCYWHSDRPPWAGKSLCGRTILVFCEQGLGDTIMCARFLPVLAGLGGAIVLVCAPALMRLLAGMPGVVAMVPRADPRSGLQLAEGTVVPPHDTWVDQMSLPLVLGITIDTVPGAGGYLRAEPDLVGSWDARLPRGRRIGLVWAGNPEHSNDRRRSVPIQQIARLVAGSAAAFVSLQVGAGQMAPAGVHDAGPALRDMADTAACIACLDLVIAVDTAVAHLAGAMGHPVWLLLPYAAEWRWMTERRDSPWYRSVRVFRQERPGDWEGVIAEVAEALSMH